MAVGLRTAEKLQKYVSQQGRGFAPYMQLEDDHKRDYQALLEPGIKLCTLDELKAIAVDRFPGSRRRPQLYAGLEALIQRIHAHIPAFSMFVDGSFLSEKVEPDDMDCAVFLRGFYINLLSDGDYEAFKHSIDRGWLKQRYRMDFYREPDNQVRREYWRSVFGFMRDRETEKGFVQLELSR